MFVSSHRNGRAAPPPARTGWWSWQARAIKDPADTRPRPGSSRPTKPMGPTSAAQTQREAMALPEPHRLKGDGVIEGQAGKGFRTRARAQRFKGEDQASSRRGGEAALARQVGARLHALESGGYSDKGAAAGARGAASHGVV